ncbi:hypothetical protein O181_028573 [Austropuccinia psidii MF-1]|uniref:Uncharacterized protein n=1 Tax=Austropuccinia psidii MF-1 TaxID=1389203 RepID=A0A9Q3H1Y7_9BASI|nr:hypothetical protein [Austropuccinia psidii MF-1]
MEGAIASTSSQTLASTFDTIIETPEADITSIPAVRPKYFLTGNNGNIPVSIQELVNGGKEAGVATSEKSLDWNNELISPSAKAHGPRKDRGCSERLDTHVLKRQVQQIKSWFKSQSILSEDQKKKLAQGKENIPVEAPQASTRKNVPQQVPNNGNKTPKNNQKGKQKAYEKAKPK